MWFRDVKTSNLNSKALSILRVRLMFKRILRSSEAERRVQK